MTRIFRIGARASALSLAQTQTVIAQFANAVCIAPGDRDHRLALKPFTTTGDKITDRRLIDAGGKGLFTKELDEALLDRRIDFAVHSMKDLPTTLPDGITLASVPARVDPRDAFISKIAGALAELQPGAVVGTASLRRQAQVLFARPDLKVETLRGNVDTRLLKIEAGRYDATYLALAGLLRLGLADRARSLSDLDAMPPAAGQGALAVTARADDAEMLAALALIDDPAAAIETTAERAFLGALDGSCRTAIAAIARWDGEQLRFIGEALAADGSARWRREATRRIGNDPRREAERLGAELGASIKLEAGPALISD